MNYETQNKLIINARLSIGIRHSVLDCSNFVNQVYGKAGMPYPYMSSKQFNTLDKNKYFQYIGKDLPGSNLEVGDVLVFGAHMGIWDPKGCTALGSDAVCKKLENNAPLLSSRGDNSKDAKGNLKNDLGVEYGIPTWWGSYNVYRWK